MKRFRVVSLSIAIMGFGALASAARAQSVTYAGLSSSSAASPVPGTVHPQLDLTYRRPTERTKLRNYFFDTFGPYPILGAAISGGINQATKTPPEWGRARSIRRANWVRLRHRDGNDDDALRVGRSLPGRHIVLPL